MKKNEIIIKTTVLPDVLSDLGMLSILPIKVFSLKCWVVMFRQAELEPNRTLNIYMYKRPPQMKLVFSLALVFLTTNTTDLVVGANIFMIWWTRHVDIMLSVQWGRHHKPPYSLFPKDWKGIWKLESSNQLRTKDYTYISSINNCTLKKS